MNHRFWLGVVYVAIIGALSNIAAVFIDRSRIKEEKFPFRPFRWEKNGRIYDNSNIDALLLSRHTAKKIRRSGGRLKGPPKRTKQQDEDFRVALTKLIEDNINFM